MTFSNSLIIRCEFLILLVFIFHSNHGIVFKLKIAVFNGFWRLVLVKLCLQIVTFLEHWLIKEGWVVYILDWRVYILLCRILFVNEMLMTFKSAFIINFESDTEPSLVDNYRFLALVPADSSLRRHLLLLLYSRPSVRLANHFALCICVSLMMLLNRCWHGITCRHPTTTSWVNWKSTTQDIIRLLSRYSSSTPFLLINHLLMHLLSLILLFAGDSILELFYILVQELFLCLLLVFSMIVLVSYLLHHRVDPLCGWLQIWEASWLLIHLAWGAGMTKVSLRSWHRLLDVLWKIADSVPIWTCSVISRWASKTALRNQVHWTVDLLCWWRSQNDFSCRTILRSLSFCTCHFVIKFSRWHSQKRWRYLLLWLLTIRYLLRRGRCRCDIIGVGNQISDIFDQIVVLLPLPVILWQLLLHLSILLLLFLLVLGFIVGGRLWIIVFVSFWLHWVYFRNI